MPEKNDHITDDLLVKHLLQETDAAELEAVENWIAAADANRAYYAHFKWIWEESKRFAAGSTMDQDMAWQRFRDKAHQKQQVKKLPVFGWMRIAASIVLIAGVLIVAYNLVGKRQARQLAVASLDRPVTDTLPDGSVITLNKQSRLSYPSAFTGKTRPVVLEGEAFFKVTPDKEKPFIIRVNDVSIKVVGTSFNVKNENGQTEVTVTTGSVQVNHNDKTIELRPEERVTVGPQDSILVKEAVTDRLYNYYESREFVCDNTPLWKLVEVLNKAYDTHIVIAREDLKQLPLTTTFDNESLDTILDVVSTTFKISVEHNGDRIILK